MKLLTRTTGYYMIISVVVFMVSGIIFYQLLDRIFEKQLDDTLTEEKKLIEETINYSDSVPDFRLVFSHMIDVTILNNPLKKNEFIRDTLMYDSESGVFDGFRYLTAENTSIRNKGYIIHIYKPLHESEKLIARIAYAVSGLFLGLMVLLAVFNYFISRRVWIPFHRTVGSLTQYDINRQEPLKFGSSDIEEFNLLNEALGKMSEKIHEDYLNLKEFNANAAHELMTPLAVIKSRLELLIQRENLDSQQMQLISSVFDATTRMSRLIQGLLLISKIENNQYDHQERVDLATVTDGILEHYDEMITHLGLTLTRNYLPGVFADMNPLLAEILMTNLLSNAIRHNLPSGMIDISAAPGTITITNTGHPPETEPGKLFERFRKSSRSPDSVGLGLSIVQKIAGLYRMQLSYTYRDGLHILRIIF
jgi:signal transduction histidine kinase